jgi:hypothetical protein
MYGKKQCRQERYPAASCRIGASGDKLPYEQQHQTTVGDMQQKRVEMINRRIISENGMNRHINDFVDGTVLRYVKFGKNGFQVFRRKTQDGVVIQHHPAVVPTPLKVEGYNREIHEQASKAYQQV